MDVAGRKMGTRTVRGARRAFSLIELLVVIVIIVILSGFTVSALSKAIRAARAQRRVVEAKTLKCALEMYCREYSRFPSHLLSNSASYSSNNYTNVFIYLEQTAKHQNPRQIEFINWSEYERDANGNFLQSGWGKEVKYWNVTVNVDGNTITVSE